MKTLPVQKVLSCCADWRAVRCLHTDAPADMKNGGLLPGRNIRLENNRLGFTGPGDMVCLGDVDFGDAFYHTVSMTISNGADINRFPTGDKIRDDEGNALYVTLLLDCDEAAEEPEKTGTVAARVPLFSTGGWEHYAEMTGELEAVSGPHRVYLLLDDSINLRHVTFWNEYNYEKEDDDFGGDILHLVNLPAESGVPLGGIGTGCFDLAPDGRFVKVMLNNTEQDFLPGNQNGFLLALWDSGTGARRLQRDRSALFGMPAYPTSTYTGLFPTSRLRFDGIEETVHPSIYAYSSLIPQNVRDSALPAAWLEVRLANDSDHSVEAAVALSWEDVIGRGIRDPENLDHVINNINVNAPGTWGWLTPTDTRTQSFEAEGHRGIRQYAPDGLPHNKDTYQNYNTDVTISADSCLYDGDGVAVSAVRVQCVPAYNPDAPGDTWSRFVQTGLFADAPSQEGPLSSREERAAASIVCARCILPANAVRTIRFLITWFAPEEEKRSGHPAATYKTADYNHYYHNFFGDIRSLTAYCAENRARLLRETEAWQRDILDSSLPDFLKFKMINSGYVLYTNSILNKAGSFTSMEGGMIGMTGTSDQRLSSHPIYQKLFTQLDRAENALFGIARDADGKIMHFTGNYYQGIDDIRVERTDPMPLNGWMIDNSMSWIIQLAKDYQNTGDKELIRRWKPAVDEIFAWLKTRIFETNGVTLQIPQGPTTYDDRGHPEVMSYGGSLYLTTLQAIEHLAKAAGDAKLAEACREQAALTRRSMLSEYMWNGKYYAYGYGVEGGRPPERVDYVFSGMLAGQFFSRYCGWEDILPYDTIHSSVHTQLTTSALEAPAYYMPKVWDPVEHRNMDTPGSSCWPFYMESYSAMLAIQDGYVDDAFNMIDQFQKIHLCKGLNWSIKLWEPGPVTYMTAPVTWFLTDVLAGFNIDRTGETITVGPVLPAGADELRIPLFYPEFWAQFLYRPAQNLALLRITKTFSDAPVVIRHVRVQPAGRPSSDARVFDIPEFVATAGAVLTFGADQVCVMRQGRTRSPLLPAVPPKPYAYKGEIPMGSGNGLRARYGGKDTPVAAVQRVDSQVNFRTFDDWKLPDGIFHDAFRVVWEGDMEMYYGGIPLHKFCVRTNGGVRLWVDGRLVLDRPDNRETENLISDPGLDLQLGHRYPIRLEFVHQGAGEPVCELNWMTTPQNYDIIPQWQLYAAED